MQTKKEMLIDRLGALKNAEVTLVTITENKANKKSRKSGEPTPSNLEIVKKYAVRREQLLAADYETIVKKRRWSEAGILDKVKKLFVGDSFEAQGTYTKPFTKNGVVLEHVETHKRYLRSLSFQDSPVESTYYDMNGNEVDFKALRDEYFKIPGQNKSQGLEEPVIVNNFTFDNVKYIQLSNGEVILNELTEPIMRKLKL